MRRPLPRRTRQQRPPPDSVTAILRTIGAESVRACVATLPLVALVVLTGCAAPAAPAPIPSPTDERLTAEQCARYATAYEDFDEIVQKPERTDEEMLAARDEVLALWRGLATEAAPTAAAILEVVALTFEAGTDAGYGSARYQEFLDVHDMMLEECSAVGL